DHAVKAMQSGQAVSDVDWQEHNIEIDLQLPAIIPNEYLPDVHTRLVLYKKIASASTALAIDEIKVEMIDRFGALPVPIDYLLRQTKLKLKAEALGIQSLKATPKGGAIGFIAKPNIDPVKIVHLISGEP